MRYTTTRPRCYMHFWLALISSNRLMLIASDLFWLMLTDADWCWCWCWCWCLWKPLKLFNGRKIWSQKSMMFEKSVRQSINIFTTLVEYHTYRLPRIPCFQTLRSAWAFFQLCLFWASKVWWRVGTSKIMRLLRNWVWRMPFGFPPCSWRLCYCLCSQCCSLLCTLRKV